MACASQRCDVETVLRDRVNVVNERDNRFSAPGAVAVPIYSHAQLTRMSKSGIQVGT